MSLKAGERLDAAKKRHAAPRVAMCSIIRTIGRSTVLRWLNEAKCHEEKFKKARGRLTNDILAEPMTRLQRQRTITDAAQPPLSQALQQAGKADTCGGVSRRFLL